METIFGETPHKAVRPNLGCFSLFYFLLVFSIFPIILRSYYIHLFMYALWGWDLLRKVHLSFEKNLRILCVV